MAQEKWLVDGPKTIDIESARTLKVGLIGGQIDIVAHDEPGVCVEVHSVTGKPLKVSVDAGGRVASVSIANDPGNGFGREARRCALSRSWTPALDHSGSPVPGTTLVNVRFDR